MGNIKTKQDTHLLNSHKETDSQNVEGTRVRALFNFDIGDTDDLFFSKGDILLVLSDLNSGWWFAKHSVTKHNGYIPCNYVVIDDGSPSSLDCWFDIGRAEAEKKLLRPGYPEGTYILRPSTNSKNYAISIRYLDNAKEFYVVKHYKIRLLDNAKLYIIDKFLFDDITILISYYKQHANGLCCRLKSPFPREHKPPIQFREIEVNRKCITLDRILGSGNFGEVWLARWNNVIEVAVKTMKQHTLYQSQRASCLEEANLMHQLHHPRIVEILGVCTEPVESPVYIITELMINGSLLEFLHSDQGKALTLSDLLFMMSQIADGMSYLESKNFIHRDLRAANVLVAEDKSVKVADFGLAKITEDVYEANLSSKFPIKWTAPEAGIHRIFSVKSDVWSFGVLMYEIITYGGDPYIGFLGRSVLESTKKGYRMPNPSSKKVNCPDYIYKIMLSCWDANPERRPSFIHLRDVLDDHCVSTNEYG